MFLGDSLDRFFKQDTFVGPPVGRALAQWRVGRHVEAALLAEPDQTRLLEEGMELDLDVQGQKMFEAFSSPTIYFNKS